MAHEWVKKNHKMMQKTVYLCAVKQLKDKDYGKVY